MAGSCSRAPRAKTFGEPFAFGRPLKLNSDPRPLSDRSNRGVHRAHHRERRDGSGPPSSSASSTTSGYSETADARSNARRQRRREPVGGYGVTPPCAMAPTPLMRTSSTSPWDFRDDDGVADAKRMRGGNAKDGDGLIFYVHPDDVPARAIKARPYEPYKPPTPEKAREKTPVKGGRWRRRGRRREGGRRAHGCRKADARAVASSIAQVRSIHWSPYDRVRVVNADP